MKISPVSGGWQTIAKSCHAGYLSLSRTQRSSVSASAPKGFAGMKPKFKSSEAACEV
jgi:hypothetical protein